MTTFTAGGVSYREAGAPDEADLRAALRENPLESWATMSLEREPDFFRGEDLLGRSVAVIAREAVAPHRPVGMYGCAFAPVHVNGAVQTVGYLGGLRVVGRHRHKLRVVRHGFDSVRAVVGNRGTVPFWFTSVSAENGPARRLLEAGLRGMPVYAPAGLLETLTVSVRQGASRGLLREATRADIPALAAFFNARASRYQFAPALSEAWLAGLDGAKGLSLSDFQLLGRGESLRGCVALWDQRGFKQAVARGYRFPLGALRRPYNLWARATRRAPLPAPGAPLQGIYAAFAAFAEPGGPEALDVVREAAGLAGRRGASCLVIGLSAANPLCAAVKRALRPHLYESCIEVVRWPEDPPPALDARPPQPEAALL